MKKNVLFITNSSTRKEKSIQIYPKYNDVMYIHLRQEKLKILRKFHNFKKYADLLDINSESTNSDTVILIQCISSLIFSLDVV